MGRTTAQKLIWTRLILSRPYGTDRDKPGELICFQRVRYKSGASKKVNLDKIDSQPSLRDRIENWPEPVGSHCKLQSPAIPRPGWWSEPSAFSYTGHFHSRISF